MNSEFMEALRALEKEKGLPMDVLIEAIEAALISAYKKNFGSSQNVRVEIDRETGEFHVYYRKEVVTEVEDDRLQISLEEAQALDPEFEEGDVLESEVTPRSFGRIAAQTAKQVVMQRLREAERNIVYDEFISREGDVLNCRILRVENRNVYLDLGKVEAVLLPAEQIPHESYRLGSMLKVYMLEVKKTTKGPQVFASRTHPGLLKRLFEMEVPEIYDGIVEIKSVVREPGVRSKIAVYSRNENVDPVGACVGNRGIRVQAVVNELNGEKVEIVRWDPDLSVFVMNALSPAKVVSININEETHSARVVVPDYQLSLAIGKEGQNARLAAKLTGWKIDIKSESQAAELAENEEVFPEEERADGEAAAPEVVPEAVEAAAEAAAPVPEGEEG